MFEVVVFGSMASRAGNVAQRSSSSRRVTASYVTRIRSTDEERMWKPWACVIIVYGMLVWVIQVLRDRRGRCTVPDCV
jgi:hypothetical protein